MSSVLASKAASLVRDARRNVNELTPYSVRANDAYNFVHVTCKHKRTHTHTYIHTHTTMRIQ